MKRRARRCPGTGGHRQDHNGGHRHHHRRRHHRHGGHHHHHQCYERLILKKSMDYDNARPESL